MGFIQAGPIGSAPFFLTGNRDQFRIVLPGDALASGSLCQHSQGDKRISDSDAPLIAGSFNGRTAGFDSANGGSIPPPAVLGVSLA